MKRIMCFIDSLGPGGAQRQLVGLAIFLKERGYNVSVVCYYDNPFYISLLQSKDVQYTYLQPAQDPKCRIWYFARYVRREKPDVVISFIETPSVCASIAHLFNRKFRLIVSERNTTQQTRWKDKLRFQLFRTADYIVPNSFSQKDYINRNFSFLSDRTITISNFVDLNYFTPSSYSVLNKCPEIIVVATIWPPKNTLGFIEAVARLKASGKVFHVSWYGKDSTEKEYLEQCQNRINQLSINDYIELKDKTHAIKEKYQIADFFCLPSFYEGTPNVICEAMACGLPILCSDVCDNGRYVEVGSNGFMFDPYSIDSMVDAINRMLSISRSEYVEFSKVSRSRAEELLSKERFVESYIKLIEED